MRATFMATVLAVALLASSQAFGFAGGGGRHGDGGAASSNATTSVPEPTSIFAVTSGLVLIGAAGWYIRRR